MPTGGADARAPSVTTLYPYQAIGVITATDPGDSGQISATGFIIDATHVLTSGHVAYDGFGLYRNIAFAAGEQGTSQPYGTAHVVAIHLSQKFVDNNRTDIDQSGDYAVLTLDQPIGAATGSFRLQALVPPADGTPSTALNGLAVQTAGYPVDLDPSHTHQYQASGGVTGLSFDLVTNLDANHGQSGSPIWVNQPQGPTAIAVLHGPTTNLSLLTQGPSGLLGPIIGAPITATVLADIQRWTAQDAGTYARAPTGQYVGGIDVNYYLQQNADVAASGIDPVQHYLTYGWIEGRLANPIFDAAWYLANNSDVLFAHADPLLHYETFGWKEGRDPSPDFSAADYLAKNPDVKLAGVNPLDHYLLYGLAEHRAV